MASAILEKMRPIIVCAQIFVLLLISPNIAFAHAPAPLSVNFSLVIIIVLPLTLLFTSLGGGYRLIRFFEDKTETKWSEVKSISGIFGFVFLVFFSEVKWLEVLLFIIYGAFLLFFAYRGLFLIYFGFREVYSRKPKEWSGKVSPYRLIPSGLMIIVSVILFSFAVPHAAHMARMDNSRGYFNVLTKEKLRSIHSSCEYYWEEKGNHKECSNQILWESTYGGYSPSSKVRFFWGGGNRGSFRLRAIDIRSKDVFEINESGEVKVIGEIDIDAPETVAKFGLDLPKDLRLDGILKPYIYLVGFLKKIF